MTDAGTAFEFLPKSPFELSNQNQYFGGWPTLDHDPDCYRHVVPRRGLERLRRGRDEAVT
jgi:hypothetical protein